MKYLVTKTVVTEHYWEDDDVAEEQCSHMRGEVSFKRVEGHEEAVWRVQDGTGYSVDQVEYVMRRYNEEMSK